MAGEAAHAAGQEGVNRAKVWLERTGRAEVKFTIYEVGDAAAFLQFRAHDDTTFAFDLCGMLNLDAGKAEFYGEVKHYSTVGGQPKQYEEYLAKCYRASQSRDLPYHFMWITWHPFSQTKWSRLCTADEVRAAVAKHKTRYCTPNEAIDDTLCVALAERLWLIVLSERQEQLSMSAEMLGTLRKAAVIEATQ